MPIVSRPPVKQQQDVPVGQQEDSSEQSEQS